MDDIAVIPFFATKSTDIKQHLNMAMKNEYSFVGDMKWCGMGVKTINNSALKKGLIYINIVPINRLLYIYIIYIYISIYIHTQQKVFNWRSFTKNNCSIGIDVYVVAVFNLIIYIKYTFNVFMDRHMPWIRIYTAVWKTNLPDCCDTKDPLNNCPGAMPPFVVIQIISRILV